MLTFLDTGVLFAAQKGDHKSSDAALLVIEDDTREFVVTNYLKLEVLAKPAFHQKIVEADFFEEFFRHCVHFPTDDNLSCKALALAKKYNLGAMDALHVSAAILSGVSEFITLEKATKPMFRVQEGVKFTSLHSAIEE